MDCRLPADEVHLWFLERGLDPLALERICESLSADELRRAARYRVDSARRLFQTARGCLRSVLGAYSGLSPAAIELAVQKAGKPHLRSRSPVDLRFNISHANEAILIAVTGDREVGVDIEFIDKEADFELIARHHFSELETVAWKDWPKEKRRADFYRLWTCKEAVLKGIGVGIGQSLARVTFQSLASGNGGLKMATYAHDDGHTGRWQSGRWQVQSLELIEGYAAAVALESGMNEHLKIVPRPLIELVD